MSKVEISTEQDLDTAIAGKRLAKEQKLWKAASGRSLRWPDVLMAVLGVLQFSIGAFGVISDGDRSSIVTLAFGVMFVCFALWRLQESRIDALYRLVGSLRGGDGWR